MHHKTYALFSRSIQTFAEMSDPGQGGKTKGRKLVATTLNFVSAKDPLGDFKSTRDVRCQDFFVKECHRGRTVGQRSVACACMELQRIADIFS